MEFATRISVDSEDSGYEMLLREIEAGYQHQVFCDGAEVTRVITADEKEGYLLAYALDAQGQPYITTDDEGESMVADRELRGRVEIRREVVE